ncbi:hypothetical protein [Cerasicoccus frondis]|uniref:hypothetical protein n=1 Tax=Cerasicoccus frondis TaxID=490090 RepID=UPI002852C0F6|nr:hypothetical protein [Cerasicoccus frondis]
MSDKERFFLLLAQYPFAQRFWDDEGLNVPALKRAAGRMSHGEQVIARCLYAIWTRSDDAFARINLTDLAGVVDAHNRKPLVEWLANPCWP